LKNSLKRKTMEAPQIPVARPRRRRRLTTFEEQQLDEEIQEADEASELV
jgi:hypothetical protein